MAVYNEIRPEGTAIVTEDDPMRPKTMYGAYKAAVEPHLWAEHIDNDRHTVSIRPCAVYGTDTTRKNIHTRPTLEAIRSGEPFDRAGGNFYVHLEDVARATVAAVERDEASGNAYNLVDCYVRFADLARMTADALGTQAEIDASSPEVPEHDFDNTLAKTLVDDDAFLTRGHDGIRAHLRDLVAKDNG
jgi:nucleoside-diphosphate-sugar epimerase